MTSETARFKSRSKRREKPELRSLKTSLNAVLPHLAKHELEELTTSIRRHYVKKFHRRKTPKYGSLNKGFTEPELQRFLRTVDDDRFGLLFSYQAYLGLRIGEVVRLNVQNINFETRELTLKSEKAQIMDSLLIPEPLFKQTVSFIGTWERRVKAANGYLFFTDATKTMRAEPFMGQDYVRNAFRKYVRQAGLDETYEVSEESVPGRAERSLHRLTTHSLRHYAITRFARQTNGNLVLTSKFARHSRPDTTMIYVSTSKSELYSEIDNAFSVSSAQRLKLELAAGHV